MELVWVGIIADSLILAVILFRRWRAKKKRAGNG